MRDNLDDIFTDDIKIIAEELEQFYEDLEGKTILIAGGKGFLGTYFTNVLIKINLILSKLQLVLMIRK